MSCPCTSPAADCWRTYQTSIRGSVEAAVTMKPAATPAATAIGMTRRRVRGTIDSGTADERPRREDDVADDAQHERDRGERKPGCGRLHRPGDKHGQDERGGGDPDQRVRLVEAQV